MSFFLFGPRGTAKTTWLRQQRRCVSRCPPGRSARPPAETDGPALETLVLQELRAINDYRALGYDIHFWRTKHGLQIDFVLCGPNGLLALEIKRSTAVGPSDLRALREFKKDYPVLCEWPGDACRCGAVTAGPPSTCPDS